jgi:hypothetical protein
MTTPPWLIIPGFIVPSLVFIHVVIYARLTTTESFASEPGWRGKSQRSRHDAVRAAAAGQVLRLESITARTRVPAVAC